MTRNQLLAGLVLWSLVAHAQTPSAPPPQFEAASIRPSKPSSDPPSMAVPSPNRLIATNMFLRDFIQSTYHLFPFQVIGVPDWASDARYDIMAKAEEDAPSPQRLIMMMKSLLADRFKMVSHTETRELPIYALVAQEAGKLGPQLRPTAMPLCTNSPPPLPVPGSPRDPIPCGFFPRVPGVLAAKKVSMPQLAAALTPLLGRIVVDRTAMTGLYDVELKFPPGLSMFTAVTEQLNLKLDDQKGPVEVLVIEHLERPSEN